MSKEYNLSEFVYQILRWKKQLIIASVLFFVLSIIGSLLLPNYYQADTTFYAASPDLAKPIPIGGDEKDVRIYGDDNDLDRLFTIASSHEVLYYLIDSFNLYEHYGIDKNNVKSKFKVREKLMSNYKTIKTKYGALLLIVEDKKPELAANIANAAREKIENIAQMVVKSSQKKLIENYDFNIKNKQYQSDSLARTLKSIKDSSGIFETWEQTSLYNKILTQAESDLQDAKGKISFYKKYPSYRDSVIRYMAVEMGAESKKEKALAELGKYAPIISQLKQLEQEQARIVDQINLDKERLKQLNSTYSVPFTALHLIESADVPVQKSRPKRSIIVLLCTLCGIMLSILAIFVIDSVKIAEKRSIN
jgi:uncharacterized protein involved in exopolysaccharide biosynthesis